MKILELLAAGGSWLGLNRKPRRYEMVTENLLPKFGPVQKGNSKSAPDPSTSPASVEIGSLFDRRETATQSSPPSLPADVGNSPGSCKQPSHDAGANVQRLDYEDFSCEEHGRSDPRFSFSKIFAAQNVAKTSRRLIQGELALDSVQVVRNDLSETDVEFVPVKNGDAKAEFVRKNSRKSRARESNGEAEFGALQSVVQAVPQ